MNKPLLVFLDLDRTLFDTRRIGEVWQELAKKYDIDAEAAAAERSKWYVWESADTYHHDFAAQLRAYGIHPKEAYAFIQASSLRDGRLEFPYVDQLVATLAPLAKLKVLTYGTRDYQLLKASLCPSLENMEVVTTLEPKEAVLRRYSDIHECWLVDDKPLGDQLPVGIHFIQVALESEVPDYTVGWPIFTSLKDVKEYLYEKLH